MSGQASCLTWHDTMHGPCARHAMRTPGTRVGVEPLALEPRHDARQLVARSHGVEPRSNDLSPPIAYTYTDNPIRRYPIPIP